MVLQSDFLKLDSFVANGLSEPFIRHIRFPVFKNLSPGTRVDFTYPITVLVGPNGTNKSSLLRALQGSPSQYNIGDFWFDTPLDPIKNPSGSENEPNRYIHGYRTPSGLDVEVLKTRVYKAGRGPDYFETSKPRRRDVMESVPSTPATEDLEYWNSTRWKPIDKNTVYLDFRQELPAYDIMMHFNWRRQANRPDQKKAAIRRGAPHVKHALSRLSASASLYGANRILEPAEKFSAAELDSVSRILGRKYESIRLVKHDYFAVEGYTASIASGGRRYTEAYAGSGEFAAIMMVRAIGRAPAASLILLDEPETSLHPGAQRELMRFIARMCVTRKHQVVIATHAPAIVEELPDRARKLLDIDSASGRVKVVSQASSVLESFSRIGVGYSPRTVVVEDKLARSFVLKAARLRGVDFLNSINVDFVPGGAQVIQTRVLPVQANLGEDRLILLDGDMKPSDPLKHPDQILDDSLGTELEKIGLSDSHLLRDGGNGDSTSQLVAAQRKTLAWAFRNLRYLSDDSSPEEILYKWETGVEAASSEAAKSHWTDSARKELGRLPSEPVDSAQILATQERALARIPDEEPLLLALANLLTEVLGGP